MKDISPGVQKVLGVILLAMSLAMVSFYSTRLWTSEMHFDGVFNNWTFLGPLDQQVIWYPLTILPVAVAFSLLVDIHETFLTYVAFAKWNFISWWIALSLPALPVWLLCDALRTGAHIFIVTNLGVLALAIGLPLIGYLDDDKRAFYKRIRLQ